MATVAAQPFSGTYAAQPVPSTFAFAVRHSGVFWFRGSLSDVAATLRADGDTLALEGSARADSISVVEPAAMRASVLGPEFFDAEHHPEIIFRSTETASPTTAGQRSKASSRSGVSHARSPPAVTTHHPDRAPSVRSRDSELQTSFDRRDFGFDWQMKLPGGGDAVGWEVEVDIDLLLKRA